MSNLYPQLGKGFKKLNLCFYPKIQLFIDIASYSKLLPSWQLPIDEAFYLLTNFAMRRATGSTKKYTHPSMGLVFIGSIHPEIACIMYQQRNGKISRLYDASFLR